MVVEGIYTLVPKKEAEIILRKLSNDVGSAVPDLSSIPLVSDPENALSAGELRLIDTGFDDLRMRATIECMPDPLRFGLRFGYGIELNDSDLDKYKTRQLGWMQRASYFLGERLQRTPTKSEFFEDYYGNGTALTLNLLNLLSNPQKAVRNPDFKMIEGMEMLDRLYGGPTNSPICVPIRTPRYANCLAA